MRQLFIGLVAIGAVCAVGWSITQGIAPQPRHWTPGQAISLCGPDAPRPVPPDCPPLVIGKDDIPDGPHDHIP